MNVPKRAQAFAAKLKATDDTGLEAFVDAELLDGVPHIFGSDAHELEQLRKYIGGGLGVPPHDVYVIGSAKTGFSLAPDTYFRPLLDKSDVDVVVIHAGLFDFAWQTFLRWHYHLIGAGDKRPIEADAGWAADRRREVWKGWFEPHHWRLRPAGGVVLSVPEALKPAREFSTTWFTTFTSLGGYRHAEIAGRDVKGRLYRTAEHLRIYHAHGLRLLRAQL
jgi:hypothetical protein